MESREAVQLDFNYKVFKPITARLLEAQATIDEIILYCHERKELQKELDDSNAIDAALNSKYPLSLAKLKIKLKILFKLTERQYLLQSNINAIQQELEQDYNIKLKKNFVSNHLNVESKIEQEPNSVDLEPNEISDLAAQTFLPRARFLLESYHILKQKKPIELIAAENITFKHNFFHKIRTRIKRYFNVFKKIIDGTDDGYAALRNVPALKYSAYQDLLNLLTPILVGSVGVIINAAEAVLGFRRARKAYLNTEQNPQRLTRIWTGIAATVLGSMGTSLAVVSITAGITGVALGGLAPFLPFLVPCFPFMIYAIELGRKSYTLNRTTALENQAKLIFDEYVQNNHEKLIAQNQLIRAQEEKLSKIKNELKELHDEKLTLIQKNIPRSINTKLIKLTEAKYNTAIEELEKLKQKEPIKTALQLKQKYEICRLERLKAERKVSLNVIELMGTTLVVTGIALGTAAIFGAASVASFGIAPLTLILTGIGLGFTLKLFEFIDNKFHNKITNTIRETFIKTKDKIILGAKNLFKPVLGYFSTKKLEPIPALESAVQRENHATTMPKITVVLPHIENKNGCNGIIPVSSKSIRTAEDQLVYAKNKSVLFNSSSQKKLVLKRTQSMFNLTRSNH